MSAVIGRHARETTVGYPLGILSRETGVKEVGTTTDGGVTPPRGHSPITMHSEVDGLAPVGGDVPGTAGRVQSPLREERGWIGRIGDATVALVTSAGSRRPSPATKVNDIALLSLEHWGGLVWTTAGACSR